MKKISSLLFSIFIVSLITILILLENNQTVEAQTWQGGTNSSQPSYSSQTECAANCSGSCISRVTGGGFDMSLCEPNHIFACSNIGLYCPNEAEIPGSVTWYCNVAPSPVPVPVCGGPCNSLISQCPIECPICAGKISQDGTVLTDTTVCQSMPTPPPQDSTPNPTKTPKPTKIPTPSPSPTATPTATLTPSPTPTKTPTPSPSPSPTPIPTDEPTPTPDLFSQDMCKCDSLEIGQVISGQNISVTAFGKVIGQDIGNAKITSYSFFAAKGDAGSTDITIFNRSGPIPAEIVTATPDLVRSKATWSFPFPANPEAGKEYRIWNTVNCERNTASLRTSQRIAEEEIRPTFFQSILNFITGLFGKKPAAQPSQSIQQTVPQPTAQVSSHTNNQLQLDWLKEGKVTVTPDEQNKCTMLRITFD